MLMSDVKQNVYPMYIYNFSYYFLYGLLQDIEYISLCYTVGPRSFYHILRKVSPNWCKNEIFLI